VISLALLLLVPPQAVSPPSGSTAKGAYESVIQCARKAAGVASFQRRNIFAISEDVAEHCSLEIDASVQSLSRSVDTDVPDKQQMQMSREYAGAKARVEAWTVVIARLESGEDVAVPVGLAPKLGEAQTRYIECSRSAGGIKFSSVFFGGQSFADTLKKSEEDRIQAFVVVGRLACPKTYQSLVDAVSSAADGKALDEQKQLQIDLAGAERFAAKTWLGQNQKK